MRFRWPKIKASDRVVFLGSSGSGKTELAKALLRTRRNAIIVDTKRVEDWSSVAHPIDEHDVGRIRQGRFAYRVPGEFLVEQEMQDKFFRAMLAAKNRAVFIDELLDMLPTRGLKILATQGRASNVGLWAATQRPHGVPLYTISEAQHFFVFRLVMEADQKRVDNALGVKIPWGDLIKLDHHFCYVDAKGALQGPAIMRL